MKRTDGRTKPNELRNIIITPNFLTHSTSSVLIEFGKTKVICAASVESGVPSWMRAQNVAGGWITSEYSLLPASTHRRTQREASRGKQSGRTLEIQRLIGRSLRSVVDMKKIGQNTIYLDCDVIDADGGTRCASITGAAVALHMALQSLLNKKKISEFPMRENVAAVSVGILEGKPILDLSYDEDSTADVDMNIVMTESGKFIEIQGTAEQEPFSYTQMEEMLRLAKEGMDKIFSIQKKILSKNIDSFGNIGGLLDEVKV